VDEIDELVAWVRAHGPAPLPLGGWDRASLWGWDAATGSLYARLWRNVDDPAGPPTIRIQPDDYTPAITWPETLAQHIAMATDCDPWSVIASMDQVVLEQGGGAGWYAGENGTEAARGDTVVTMAERYIQPEWPYRPKRW